MMQRVLDEIRRWLAHALRAAARGVEPPLEGRPVTVRFLLRHRADGPGHRPRGWWRGVLLGDPCVYCGAPATTIDHVWPRSTGGPDHWDNKAPACVRCNRAKAAHTLLHFLVAQRPSDWRPSLMGKTAATTRQQRQAILKRPAPGGGTIGEAARQRPAQAPYWVNDMRRRQPTDVDLREMARQRATQ